MEYLRFGGTEFSVDPVHGCITSLTVGTIPLIAAESPLFTFCVRTPDAQTEEFSSMQGALCDAKTADNALVLSYNGFGGAAVGITVTLALTVVGDALESRVSVHNEGGNMVEWVGVLPLILPKLKGEGGSLMGEMLYPFNEGAIVDSMAMRESSWLTDHNPQYPSMGCYPVFPNMICSQMMAYLYETEGEKQSLYFGAHDSVRGVKVVDFVSAADGEGVEMRFRYYCGVDYGAD